MRDSNFFVRNDKISRFESGSFAEKGKFSAVFDSRFIAENVDLARRDCKSLATVNLAVQSTILVLRKLIRRRSRSRLDLRSAILLSHREKFAIASVECAEFCEMPCKVTTDVCGSRSEKTWRHASTPFPSFSYISSRRASFASRRVAKKRKINRAWIITLDKIHLDEEITRIFLIWWISECSLLSFWHLLIILSFLAFIKRRIF